MGSRLKGRGMILLTDEEIKEARLRDTSYHPMSQDRCIAKAQLKKVVEYIEKYVYYVDNRGYIALKPNATKNWQALLDEIKD